MNKEIHKSNTTGATCGSGTDIIPLPIFTYIVVLTVYASSCYKTSGSYVYFTYCSGYCSGSYGHEKEIHKSNTTGATCGSGTVYPFGAPEFTTGCSGARVARSLVFCVVISSSLFVPLYFFFWPLCCLRSNLVRTTSFWYNQIKSLWELENQRA
jgi:hypothetical protein